jgi:hypothetical protein
MSHSNAIISCQQWTQLSTPYICCKRIWTRPFHPYIKSSSVHVPSHCNRALLCRMKTSTCFPNESCRCCQCVRNWGQKKSILAISMKHMPRVLFVGYVLHISVATWQTVSRTNLVAVLLNWPSECNECVSFTKRGPQRKKHGKSLEQLTNSKILYGWATFAYGIRLQLRRGFFTPVTYKTIANQY